MHTSLIKEMQKNNELLDHVLSREQNNVQYLILSNAMLMNARLSGFREE